MSLHQSERCFVFSANPNFSSILWCTVDYIFAYHNTYVFLSRIRFHRGEFTQGLDNGTVPVVQNPIDVQQRCHP
jgi:hypothetical protein